MKKIFILFLIIFSYHISYGVCPPGSNISFSIGLIENVKYCYGNLNASFKVENLSGGNAPYIFSLNSSTGINTSYTSSNSILNVWDKTTYTFQNLGAGTYTVSIKDRNDCVSSTNQTITITQPNKLKFNVNIINLDCTGQPKGQVEIINLTNNINSLNKIRYNLGGLEQIGNPLFVNLQAGGYLLTVKDTSSNTGDLYKCYIDTFIIVTQPTEFYSSTSNIKFCSPDNIGKISISVSNPLNNFTYSYSINNGVSYQSSPSFNGLAQSDYYIKVRRNEDNCISQTLVTSILRNTKITYSTVFTNILCNGFTSLVSFINVNGGGGNKDYFANNNSSSNTFTAYKGKYTLFIVDGDGCHSDTSEINITEPDLITLDDYSTINLNCYGDNSGSINIKNVKGGNGNFSFSLNGGTYQSSTLFENLAAGSYSLVIRDKNNCFSNSNNIILLEPSKIGFTTLASEKLCFNDNNGFIEISNITGGNSTNYQTIINLTDSYQSKLKYTNLNSGNYTVIIKSTHATDALNCYSSPKAVQIVGLSQIQSETILKPPTCKGGNDGKINLNTYGGNPTYTGSGEYFYLINNINRTLDANKEISLSPGNYTLKIKDNFNCESPTSNFTIPDETNFSFTVNPTNVSCFGNKDGKIDITITSINGSRVPTFSINGKDYYSTRTFSNLSEGTYIINGKDNFNCIADNFRNTTVSVDNSELVVSLKSKTNPSCNSVIDGIIELNTPTGGKGSNVTYEYYINGNLASSNVINNLIGGTYTLFVKEQAPNTCVSKSINVTLTDPIALNLDILSIKNKVCFGQNDGNISVIAKEGTPGYQYSFNGGPFSLISTLNNIPPSTLNIVAKDSRNCTTSNTFTFTELNKLDFTYDAANLSCFNFNDGSISLKPTGGIGYSYHYVIGGTTIGKTNNLFLYNLTPDFYDIKIVDDNLCESDVKKIEILNKEYYQISISKINPTCFGINDGKITIYIPNSKSVNDFEYTIDNGITYSTSPNFTKLSDGVYNVFGKKIDDNCPTQNFKVNLTQPNNINYNVTKSQINCNFNSAEMIFVDVLNCDDHCSYSVDSGQNFYKGRTVFSSYKFGVYNTLIRDTFGCLSKSYKIDFGVPFILSPISQSISCFGAKDGFIDLMASGGIKPYNFTLLNTNKFQTFSKFNDLEPGTYTFRVNDYNDCKLDTTITLPNKPISTIFSNFELSSKYLDIIDNTTDITNLSRSNIKNYWTIANNKTTEENLINYNFPEKPGLYKVILVVQDIHGCYDTSFKDINVYDAIKLSDVITFTPNNDDVNDKLNFISPEKVERTNGCNFKIYDDGGFLIKTSNNCFWDGSNEANEFVNAGLYYYSIELKLNTSQISNGKIFLIR